MQVYKVRELLEKAISERIVKKDFSTLNNESIITKITNDKIVVLTQAGECDIDITIGSLKDGDCVGIFQTAGQMPTLYFDNSILERSGLQVIVRNKSYEECNKLINSIFNSLNRQVGFNPQQSPFYLGRSENGYAEFSVNYIVLTEN